MSFLAQASTEETKTPDNATEGNEQVVEGVQDVAEAVDSESGFISQFLDSGALGLLLDGGFFMWPILILGIIAIAVIIERYRSLRMLNNDDEGLRQQVLDLLTQDRVEDAMNLCDSQRGPVAAVLSNGLRKYLVLRRLGHDPAKIEEQVIQSMESYSVHIVAALERHLPILATISSVAPMIGFLGTVQGMIVSFTNIVEMMGEQNIVEAAASGIKVALLTTCFGLIVGIPAFIGFNYFSSIINRFVLEVESTATELVEIVTTLEPNNRPGRITLISRVGAANIRETLPPLIAAVREAGRVVTWVCDPMHGNTTLTDTGLKTRNYDLILEELAAAFEIHQEQGGHLGGVHFELTGDDVTECTGGPQELSEADLSRSYETYCDPRLNYAQSLELALRIAQRLQTLRAAQS